MLTHDYRIGRDDTPKEIEDMINVCSWMWRRHVVEESLRVNNVSVTLTST